MRKFTKIITTMSLAFALVATLIVPTASAATNNQASINALNQGNTKVATYTLATKKDELTIGKGGSYNLVLELGKAASASDLFAKVTNNQITFVVGYDEERNENIYQTIDVTWSSNLPAYASVNANGRVTAKKVCKLNANGSYKRVVVSASIPDVNYTNKNGETFNFKGGAIYKNYITIVPEADLSVYFLGVWNEDEYDNDAQHYGNFAVNSTNVETQLKAMAEAITNHCVGTSFDVVAYTKTNDAEVRAYITTSSILAGNHYYVMKFKTDDTNKITVTERDYCETSYKLSGRYFRPSGEDVK